MKVYLIRHGQSEANASEVMSFPTTNLTQMGREDGRRVGKMLEHINFDRVFTSPYTRAMQTQKAAFPDVDGEVLDCLHEFECGWFEGKSVAELKATLSEELMESWRYDNFRIVGGEDYEDVRVRCREFLSFMSTLDCNNVIAFSHAGFLLTLFDEITGRKDKIGRNLKCDNGGICVIEYDGKKWTVASWNNTGYSQ